MELTTIQDQSISAQDQKVNENVEASILENVTKLFRIDTVNQFRGYVNHETNYEKLTSDKDKFDTPVKLLYNSLSNKTF